jgi:hypothetical protein
MCAATGKPIKLGDKVTYTRGIGLVLVETRAVDKPTLASVLESGDNTDNEDVTP